MVHIATVLGLMFLFEIKHLLCDYYWQTDYMLGKFKLEGWIKPLALHCAVHAVTSFWILLLWWALSGNFYWYLALFDFVCHFIMDRIKASPRMLGRYVALSKQEYSRMKEVAAKPDAFGNIARRALDENRIFWWNIGVDQFVHQLTHLAIIAWMVLN